MRANEKSNRGESSTIILVFLCARSARRFIFLHHHHHHYIYMYATSTVFIFHSLSLLSHSPCRKGHSIHTYTPHFIDIYLKEYLFKLFFLSFWFYFHSRIHLVNFYSYYHVSFNINNYVYYYIVIQCVCDLVEKYF